MDQGVAYGDYGEFTPLGEGNYRYLR